MVISKRTLNWIRFLLNRFFQLFIVLVGVSIVTFIVTHSLGSPIYLLVGQSTSQEMIDAITIKLGLDKPLWEQYLIYVNNLLKGDFGTSRYSFNPVLQDISSRLPATLELALYSLLFSIFWAIPVGIFAAVRKDRWVDVFARFMAKLGTSIPGFWLGLLLIFIFFAKFSVLPGPLGRIEAGIPIPPRVTGLLTIDSLLAGREDAFISSFKQLLLPSITLAFTVSPSILLLTRNTMISVLESEYIRSSQAFGLSPRKIYFKYGFKNVFAAIITMVAMTFGYLIGGTVLVEVVFAWPGIGIYAVDAMNHSDYEPIIAVVLLSALFYNLVYLLADIARAIIAPRQRL
jgi:peptide/nickel transport system permease protein